MYNAVVKWRHLVVAASMSMGDMMHLFKLPTVSIAHPHRKRGREGEQTGDKGTKINETETPWPSMAMAWLVGSSCMLDRISVSKKNSRQKALLSFHLMPKTKNSVDFL